jgi:16S rRNA (cytosine1402-N4)-methyltransferase
MVREAMEALAVRPGGAYLDATAGGGGHLKEIAARLDNRGTIIGIDRDPDAIAWISAHRERGGATVVLEQCPFSHFDTVLSRHHIGPVDGMLLDLGVSSHQIDTQERGFSYMKTSDLDMRMDPAAGIGAAEFCARSGEDELARVLSAYGDITNPLRMARAIKTCAARRPLRTSADLVACLRNEYGPLFPVKVIAKVFQALRIAVNGELDELAACLSKAIPNVKHGGRIVVISYHSLEDRIVKNFFRDGEQGCICPPVLPRCVCGKRIMLKRVNKKVIVPATAEVEKNPRARSARLRAAQVVV